MICQLRFDQAFVCWHVVIVVESYDGFWDFFLDRDNAHRLELALSPVRFLKLNLTVSVIILSDYLDVDWEDLQILRTAVGIRLEVWWTVSFLVKVFDRTLLFANIWRLFTPTTDQDSVRRVWGQPIFGPLRVTLRIAVTPLAAQKVSDCMVRLL